MVWIARGQSGNGYVQNVLDGRTQSVPAIATHRGELWCLWSDPAGDLYYAVGDNNIFGTRVAFPGRGIPVMAELAGILHAIIVRDAGDMAHFIFEDSKQKWIYLNILDRPAGFFSNSTPAFVAFHNKLVLAFVHESTLLYSCWTLDPRSDTASWNPPQEVSGISKVRGVPALFVLDGILHVICSADDENREILGFAYASVEDIWNSSGDVSEGKAAVGVSATSFGDSAFLAFQENGPENDSHQIFISEYMDGQWREQESVAGQMSTNPPQLAVLNGRLNCIFNANDDDKSLRWYSRPLLDYSLSSWMEKISDDTLLSNITCPGTHDSCARSSIPFVRTQYLSITKQLEAGLRFFDLRCRAHSDGLYMYHGGVPINLPVYLKLDEIMNEIFIFFSKGKEAPTETVLISINNDDTSNKEPFSVFYDAIASHIDSTPCYSDGSSRWITSPKTVTLGAARGKAVLLRRYHADPFLPSSEHIGIDLSGWLDNKPDFSLKTPSGVTIHLQDHWKYSEIQPLSDLISSKLSYVSNMLSKAAAGDPEEWFLNFTSAVGDPVEKGEIAESHWIAVGAHSKFVGRFVKGMNVSVRKDFKWGSKTRYGVVAMDYPELPKDSDLIAWLIGTNL